MIPHIIFRYSDVYDDILKNVYQLQFQDISEYPTPQVISKFIKNIKQLWKVEEGRVLEELSLITNLQWKEESILCYVVGRVYASFSDPLTIPAYEGQEEYAIDVLIHELIHNLFTQEGNYEKSQHAWEYFTTKYNSYSENTQIHIPLVAFHIHIYKKFFDSTRLQRDREFLSKHHDDYKKAWEIVDKAGYKEIIENFVKRIEK